MKNIVIALIVLVLPGLHPCLNPLTAQPYSPVPEQTMVRLKDGRTVFGEARWDAGRLALIARADGGEVEYRFRPEEIEDLRLPENEAESLGLFFAERGAHEDALAHLESLLPERLALAPILTGAQLRPLLFLAHAYFETGRFVEGVKLANSLYPHITDERNRSSIEKILLIGSYRLDLHAETRELAEAWCRRQQRSGRSALGWWLLAEMALKGEEYEEALWISLQPIAFSSALNMEFLGRAYAVAATAARAVGEDDHGFLLFLEMKERNLVWPDSPLFGESGVAFRERQAAEQSLPRANDPSPADGPDTGTPPPEEDLDLPLQAIRRLLPAR